ncbi:transposase [Nocardia amamiensis]|uniref:Transposase n=1 Tax=Nocardia amamiensis TaxID=404578 RepID=A0ABS0CZV6_9NOCA|nr:transposase [Nocardia amamiensis]
MVRAPVMGAFGDCYDNAVIESFWGRMQTELLNRQRWKTRIELANAIFEYLEIFHNRQRRHSALGMRTPIEYERMQQSIQPWPRVKSPDSAETGVHQSLRTHRGDSVL